MQSPEGHYSSPNLMYPINRHDYSTLCHTRLRNISRSSPVFNMGPGVQALTKNPGGPFILRHSDDLRLQMAIKLMAVVARTNTAVAPAATSQAAAAAVAGTGVNTATKMATALAASTDRLATNIARRRVVTIAIDRPARTTSRRIETRYARLRVIDMRQ